jgi:TolA-binding protein
MIFNTQVTTVQNQVNSNADTIEQLQNQIEMLRQQNLELQSHLQALGTAESAAESAVAQLQTAISLIKAIDPSQLRVLKEVVDGLFEIQGQEDVKLIAEVDEEPTVTEPKPTPNTPTIEVKSETPTNGSISKLIKNLYEESNDSDSVSYNNLSYAQLKELCAQRGLETFNGKRRMSRVDLIAQLKAV